MSKYLGALGLILVTVLSCEEEPISIPLKKTNIRHLLTGGSTKTWVLTDNGSDSFDPCVDEEWLVFMDLDVDSDTGSVLNLKPRVLCDPADTLNEIDTLASYQWVFANPVGSIFDDSLIFIDENESFKVTMLDLQPQLITLEFLLSSPLTQKYVPLDN